MIGESITVGIITTGGLGSRLYPVTTFLNKHLLPVGGRPMFYYPLDLLYRVGCRTVVVILGGKNDEEIIHSCNAWQHIGELREVKFVYVKQWGVGGIANALLQADLPFRNARFCLALGDNIFLDNNWTSNSALLFEQVAVNVVIRSSNKKVISQSGIAYLDGVKIRRFKEKPKTINKAHIATGFYVYPNDVFNKIRTLTPSKRGEFEITDLNNLYAKEGRMHHLKHTGKWFDCGTWESIGEANECLSSRQK